MNFSSPDFFGHNRHALKVFKRKKNVPFLVRFTLHRDVLSSQEAILQLLSALLSLTSVFGMGTGVASMPSSRHGI